MDSARAGSVLVLFTARFPYDVGEEFIEDELPYLCATFDRVLLIPTDLPAGAIQTRQMPSNVTAVAEGALPGYEGRLRAAATHAVRHPQDVARALVTAATSRRPIRHVVVDLKFDFACRMVSRRVRRRLRVSVAGAEHVVFYSYWLHKPARVAVHLRKQLRLRPIKIVSRAHGFDVFAERQPSGYLPQRDLLLRGLWRIFPVCDAARERLVAEWPMYRDKIQTRRLGVAPAGSPMNGSLRPLTILSCSRIVPVKRLDRLIAGIHHAQSMGVPVRWIHIGGAVDEMYGAQIRDAAASALAAGSYDFLGHLDHDAVRRWLDDHPVSVFANVSESEGAPVTIQEALAQGLPVIATDVGGNAELVGGVKGAFNGLLPADFRAADFAALIVDLNEMDSRAHAELTAASLAAWDSAWRADRNYSAFAAELLRLG